MEARDRVLNTTELLENILQHLPMRDLLLTQRTSKCWRNVVEHSIKLQRALFFEPEKRVALTLVLDDRKAKKYWIKLKDCGERELLSNPLLERIFQPFESPNGTDFSLAASLPPSWRNENASWRHMLPAQPAIHTSAYIGLWGLSSFWLSFYTERVVPMFCTTQVRIGQIFDDLDKRYGKFPYGRKKIMIVGLED